MPLHVIPTDNCVSNIIMEAMVDAALFQKKIESEAGGLDVEE